MVFSLLVSELGEFLVFQIFSLNKSLDLGGVRINHWYRWIKLSNTVILALPDLHLHFSLFFNAHRFLFWQGQNDRLDEPDPTRHLGASNSS